MSLRDDQRRREPAETSGATSGRKNRERTPADPRETRREIRRMTCLDRYWLLTWTTYGTWLPGDDRGFVSNIDRGDGKGHRLNRCGTSPASALRGLTGMAERTMTGPPVMLDEDQANVLFQQLQETAAWRGWQLQSVAIMRNHVHLVVGVPGDPEPETLLRDFKSYGSRALNRSGSRPRSGTWWTESGSRRKLPDERAIASAVAYVRDQQSPLVVWVHPKWQVEIGPRRDRKPQEANERIARPASGGRQSPVSGARPSDDHGDERS